MKLLIKAISTVLGVGYSPIAPGTCGAIVACIFFWYGGDFGLISLTTIIILTFILGTITATLHERDYILKFGEVNGHDPQVVVIDEFVGMLISLIALPKTLPILIASFILFRFFDIVKPFPINRSQNLSSGWGIMMDDVIAGLFANILIQLYLLIDAFI